MSENTRCISDLRKFLRLQIPSLFLFIYLLSVFGSSVLSSSGQPNLAQERTNFETRNISRYEEEYKTFEQEMEKQMMTTTTQASPSSRQKRYIYLNVQSNLDVGFLCVIPITIVLPPMSNLFNKWRRRKRRSLDVIEEEEFGEQDDDPNVQPHLDKIVTYFELLDIPERHCQLRALCEFSADPTTYYPLSEMMLSRLRAPSNMFSSSITTTNKTASLYEKYNTAANDGSILGHSGCEKEYGTGCKYSMNKLLSMNFLRVWKGLRTQFGVDFKEDFNL